MGSFFTAVLAAIGTKLISLGVADVEGWVGQVVARLKQAQQDSLDVANLEAAENSGSQSSIDQDGLDLLNGGPPSAP